MSVISDIKMILESNNIHLLHDAKSYLEQIERWDAIKDADLVEVVRCKDCKHLKMKIGWGECDIYKWSIPYEVHYCGYGKRRNDDKG